MGVAGSAATKMEVRPVDADERAAWEPYWKRYQAFYKVALPEETTEVTWRRLQDPAEPMFVLGAYVDGGLVGIVHYLFHRSTWAVGGYCYLQDLFTDEGSRGLGIGRALIEAVYAEAKKAGVGRVYWHTHETNVPARALYDKVAEHAGFIQYRKSF
jgi:GNAT superfamily N-acetyltransferase